MPECITMLKKVDKIMVDFVVEKGKEKTFVTLKFPDCANQKAEADFEDGLKELYLKKISKNCGEELWSEKESVLY